MPAVLNFLSRKTAWCKILCLWYRKRLIVHKHWQQNAKFFVPERWFPIKICIIKPARSLEGICCLLDKWAVKAWRCNKMKMYSNVQWVQQSPSQTTPFNNTCSSKCYYQKSTQSQFCSNKFTMAISLVCLPPPFLLIEKSYYSGETERGFF